MGGSGQGEKCWVCRVRDNREVRPETLVSPELHQWIRCGLGGKRENEVDSECSATASM